MMYTYCRGLWTCAAKRKSLCKEGKIGPCSGESTARRNADVTPLVWEFHFN